MNTQSRFTHTPLGLKMQKQRKIRPPLSMLTLFRSQLSKVLVASQIYGQMPISIGAIAPGTILLKIFEGTYSQGSEVLNLNNEITSHMRKITH